jgi:hypothetical protein
MFHSLVMAEIAFGAPMVVALVFFKLFEKRNQIRPKKVASFFFWPLWSGMLVCVLIMLVINMDKMLGIT